jgi:hypothetical protein
MNRPTATSAFTKCSPHLRDRAHPPPSDTAGRGHCGRQRIRPLQKLTGARAYACRPWRLSRERQTAVSRPPRQWPQHRYSRSCWSSQMASRLRRHHVAVVPVIARHGNVAIISSPNYARCAPSPEAYEFLGRALCASRASATDCRAPTDPIWIHSPSESTVATCPCCRNRSAKALPEALLKQSAIHQSSL